MPVTGIVPEEAVVETKSNLEFWRNKTLKVLLLTFVLQAHLEGLT